MAKAAGGYKGDRDCCCGIQWGQVFKHQTYGALVVLILAAVITGVSHFFNEPEVRPVTAFDPTISYPLKQHDTVPMANAAAYPFIALIISIMVVEFGIMHGKQSLTMSVQAAIHVLFMAIVGFAVVLSVTEATKPVASRYRPDFLGRCQPKNITADGKAVLPTATVTNILSLCTGAEEGETGVADGRKSFPSGHSSNTLSVCWYCALYLVHALYFRQGFVYMGGLWRKSAKSAWWRLLHEFLQGLLIVWVCVVIGIAWWVGVSRYVDHRHNIDDILGGFMIALLWMTPITLISIAQLHFYHKHMKPTDNENELQLPAVGAAANGAASAVPGTQAVQALQAAPAVQIA